MGVKVVKAGKSYIDRTDKRVTESPTYNPYLFKFGHAMCLPISATTVLASELIEGGAIDYLREVFVCANQRSERAGSYGGTRVQGICKERPASFYLNPLQTFIETYADYLQEKDNTHMIQLAQTRLRNFGSVAIRPFLEMRTPAVTSNVVIDLTDNVDIHEISDDDVEILRTLESVKSDESSDADLHSKLQEMFTGEALDEILSSEKQTCLNTIIKHFQKDRLGSFADLDLERYMSLKKFNDWARAFAPSRLAAVAARTLPLGAATLDATTATAPVNGAVQVEAESAAIVEKDWAVADFVKDSDRVLP
jgi:hypothetical protein